MEKDREDFEKWASAAQFHSGHSVNTVEAFAAWIAALNMAGEATGLINRQLREENVALKAKNEQLKNDAERYRWLRAQHWDEADFAVVRHPKMSVKLGFDCPSLQRLDEYIDAAMKEEK